MSISSEKKAVDAPLATARRRWSLVVGLLAALVPLPVYFAWRDARERRPPDDARAGSGSRVGPQRNAVSIDLGVLSPKSQVERSVTLTNDSTHTWTVKGASSDCTCLVEEVVPRVIAPGQSFQVRFRFKAGDNPGRIDRHMHVSFKEPEAGPIIVSLTGTVRAWAEASPHVLSFGTILRGSKTETTFEVAVVGPQVWDAKKVRTTLPGLELRLLSSRDIVHEVDGVRGTAHRLRASYTAPADATGIQSGQFQLAGPTPEKTLIVPVRASVVPPMSASPAQIFLGFMPRGADVPIKATITLNDPTIRAPVPEFAISHGPDVSVTLSAGPTDHELVLTGSFRAGEKSGSRATQIKVIHRDRELTVRVFAYVR